MPKQNKTELEKKLNQVEKDVCYYKDAYHDEKDKFRFGYLIAGILVGLFSFVIVYAFIPYYNISFDDYGSKICGSYGLVYDDVSFENAMPLTNIGWKAVPIIKCVNATENEQKEKHLLDGVVLKVER